ncbi:MAG: Rieske (2Fe-2S) protein [Haloarculaceae archaeon]
MSGAGTDDASGSRIEVCTRDELPPGERTIVERDGIEIGVFNVDGELYAVSNTCPHRSGPVCEGQVQTEIVADWPGPGYRPNERVSDEPTIACPWHGWEFELATGEHIGDDEFAVPSYDVVDDDGMLYVEL